MRLIILSAFLTLFFSCINVNSQDNNTDTVEKAIKEYWSDGKAEVSRYTLNQQRYGEERQGDLVQIFVPEDFLTDRQVKNESYTSDNSTRILKRIETRQFNTGIYQYNMSSNSFTAFDFENFPTSLKVSAASMEWCGTSYTQLNRNGNRYKITMHSYFENEGDQEQTIKDAIPEEELYARIRMAPSRLPMGEFRIIPSQIVSRFLHLPLKAYMANGEAMPSSNEEIGTASIQVYKLEIPELKRTLEIYYEDTAPYVIRGWKDSYPNAFSSEVQSSTAVLTDRIKEAYWKLNSKKDSSWRKKLELEN